MSTQSLRDTIQSPLRIIRAFDFRKNIVVVALLVVSAIFAVSSPVFLNFGNLMNLLRQSSIIVVLGLGLTFVILAAEIDISIGSVMGLTAMIAAVAMQSGYGWIGGIAAGVTTGFLIGLFNGVVSVYSGAPSFLVTLGTLAWARGLALIITDTRPVLVENQTFFSIFNGTVSQVPIIALWAIALFVVTYFILKYTRFGRHVYITGDNETTARYTGIDTAKVRIATLTISGVLAGIAGLLLLARLNAARPTAGIGIELAVIAAVILGGTSLFGGRGWIFGTVIGAVLLAVIDNGLILNGFGSSYQRLIRGIIIILAVAFRSEKASEEWI